MGFGRKGERSKGRKDEKGIMMGRNEWTRKGTFVGLMVNDCCEYSYGLIAMGAGDSLCEAFGITFQENKVTEK